jgi:hypothetical protein
MIILPRQARDKHSLGNKGVLCSIYEEDKVTMQQATAAGGRSKLLHLNASKPQVQQLLELEAGRRVIRRDVFSTMNCRVEKRHAPSPQQPNEQQQQPNAASVAAVVSSPASQAPPLPPRDGRIEGVPEVGKRHFFAPCYYSLLKMILLPRQAWDKHREKLRQTWPFSRRTSISIRFRRRRTRQPTLPALARLLLEGIPPRRSAYGLTSSRLRLPHRTQRWTEAAAAQAARRWRLAPPLLVLALLLVLLSA